MAATHALQKYFADYDAMLDDPDLNAVISATSDAFHVPESIRALKAGKHLTLKSAAARKPTATACCGGVKMVCNRCGVWQRSCTVSRCFHLQAVCSFVGETIHWIVF